MTPTTTSGSFTRWLCSSCRQLDLPRPGSGIAADEGEAALHGQMAHTEQEAVEARRLPEGLGGDVGGKRIPFQAEQREVVLRADHFPPPLSCRTIYAQVCFLRKTLVLLAQRVNIKRGGIVRESRERENWLSLLYGCMKNGRG